MKASYLPTKIFIVVKTYPLPSRGHQELVCTAGITETREWVRLYPIDYRYRPQHQQFHKYQWIEVGLRERGAGKDNRQESREPDLESIRLLGEPLDTSDRWMQRRVIIDAMPHFTVSQLRAKFDENRTSLGIVRPQRVLDLKIEPAGYEWKPKWQALFDQLRLFGPAQKPLRKIPYKFSYVFECDDSTKAHSAMIEDWELGMLFLNEADRLGSDEAAAQSVKRKFLEELCRADKDTRFFMGTTFPYNSWVVIGVFWPPKIAQPRLTGLFG